MQILVVEPGKVPVIAEISGTLKEMQEIVGGTIQAIYPFPEDVTLVCNDEGKLLGMPPNHALRDERGNPYDIICGTFFLCGVSPDNESFSSLSQDQLTRFQRQFHTPEVLCK